MYVCEGIGAPEVTDSVTCHVGAEKLNPGHLEELSHLSSPQIMTFDCWTLVFHLRKESMAK